MWAAQLFCFSIPFHQKASTVLLVLWLLASLWVFKAPQRKKRYLLLLPALFATYVLGMMLTTPQDFSILGRKLSLVVFPIIFALHAYDKKARLKIYIPFIYGLVASSILSLLFALFNSTHFFDGSIVFDAAVEKGRGFLESVTFGGNFFFGEHLSLFHQTVYFSMYLCVGVALLLSSRVDMTNSRKMPLILFFGLMIFLVSNKAGILVFVSILVLRLFTAKIAGPKKIVLLIAFLIFSLLLVRLNPRFDASVSKILNSGFVVDKEARYDFSTRLLSWDASIDLIKRSPGIGYGPGGAQKALDSVYLEKGYKYPLKEKYNAHNQFLQIWLENGLLGLLVFSACVFLILKKGLMEKKHRFVFLATVAIFFINACFESYLNRYSGISFFAFWWCLIVLDSDKNET